MTKTLLDVVRNIGPGEDAFLIVWDRQTGQYRVSYQGQEIYIASVNTLLASITEKVNQQIDTEGRWTPSVKTSVSKNSRESWKPPWLKQ